MTDKVRSAGLDIIRSAAIALVLLTHMFAYTDVLSESVGSPLWHIFNIIHYASRICVPLFLLLTGFLQNRRKPDKRHYSSIIPVLVSYYAVCFAYIIACGILGGGITLGGIFDGIMKTLNFTVGYSWYVEMYICLFLLIPFLNIMFNSLDGKKQLLLIFSLAGITLLPPLLNGFLIGDTRLDILPDFLENMYVVTYYFIGSYIAKHKPAPKKAVCAAVFVLTLVCEDVICLVCSKGGYAWWLFNSHSSLSHTIAAVSLFLMFYNVNLKNRVLCAMFKEISVCSFEMYLISFFTDSLFYSVLGMPPVKTVVLNFVSAYVLARVFRLAAVPVSKRILKAVNKQTAAENTAPKVPAVK